jgi:hypothetical protein
VLDPLEAPALAPDPLSASTPEVPALAPAVAPELDVTAPLVLVLPRFAPGGAFDGAELQLTAKAARRPPATDEQRARLDRIITIRYPRLATDGKRAAAETPTHDGVSHVVRQRPPGEHEARD